MGKIGAEICSICKENPSKYRCPGCAAPYCSLACSKTHKSGAGGDHSSPPCTGKRAQLEDAKSGNKANGHPQVSSSGSSGGQSAGKRPRCAEPGDGDGGAHEAVTTACVRKGRDQWRGGREDREDEEWQMSADQRARLSGCAWLKAALRDPKLQKLLAEIDVAQDREKALAFHRTSTQFGEFMDKLLVEIEEYRKGGAGEPDLVAADP